MSGFLAFLGYFEVGARLYEVSIPSTLYYIVVLIAVGKSYKKVLTLEEGIEEKARRELLSKVVKWLRWG